jgi:hypothetical protein
MSFNDKKGPAEGVRQSLHPSGHSAGRPPPIRADLGVSAASRTDLEPAGPSFQAIIDRLYIQIRMSIALKDTTTGNAMLMLTTAMAAAEKQKHLSGADKKRVVVTLVGRLVGDIPRNSEDKRALVSAVDLLLPSLIDTLVAATLNKFDLNRDGDVSAAEVGKASASLWRACFTCCLPPAD